MYQKFLYIFYAGLSMSYANSTLFMQILFLVVYVAEVDILICDGFLVPEELY